MKRQDRPAEIPPGGLLRGPLGAMEIEGGIHATVKFHLPYRLLSRSPEAIAEAGAIAMLEVAKLIASLVPEVVAAPPPPEPIPAPPPIPMGSGGNPGDGEECLACQ